MKHKNLDESKAAIEKEWKKKKITVLQGVLDDFNVTTENVKERCSMEVVSHTREEKLFIDGKLVITINGMGWQKHYGKV